MPSFEGTSDSDNLTGTSQHDTLIGGSGDDTLMGGGGDDSLSGGAGNDFLEGKDGNDTLNGGAGNDALYGGLGDDLIIQGGSGIQLYDGGDGNDTFFTDTAVFSEFTLPQGFVAQVNLNTGLSGAKFGTGNLNDIVSNIENITTQGDWDWELVGNNGDNILISGEGDDVIIAGAGNDTIHPGEGDDVVDAGDGDDVVYVTTGNDFEDGGAGNDTLALVGANTSIFAITYNFRDGSISRNGGLSTPNTFANFENFTIGTNIDGRKFENSWNITVVGTRDANRINTASGNDFIEGDGGDDSIDAGAGNDTVLGGEGNDTITDGLGNDSIDAGEGIDTYFRDFDMTNPNQTWIPHVDLSREGLFSPSFGNPSASDDALVNFENVRLFGSMNTIVTGDSSKNNIETGSGSDTIFGNDGDDTLKGGAGDDILDGGDGFDTAILGPLDRNNFVLDAGGLTVFDRDPDGFGTDFLTNIELLVGSDGATLSLEQFNRTALLTTSDLEKLIEFYIAYFNRAPDAYGLNYWGTAFANGTTLEEMAALFVDQDETRETYPASVSNNEFVTAVYGNVLGRTPDQAGFAFWVDILNRSEETGVTRDQFILSVLRGVNDGTSDRAYLDNKVDVGAYFAVHRGMSDVDIASAVMDLYDGTRSSIAEAVSSIDHYYQDILSGNKSDFIFQVVGILDNPIS